MTDPASATPLLQTARPIMRTEPVQQRSADRITHLLDAAAQAIDEHGIDGLTTSDVAQRSGSSVGVVYRYFPNIQSLLRALAARNMDRFTACVFGALDREPARWLSALDPTIDAYVDLCRSEPGFRALGFGDVIAKRFLETDVSNNTALARVFGELMNRKYGTAPTADLLFDLEVLIEIADALLSRAFLYDRDGDERFIEKLRQIVREYMKPHETAVVHA